MPRPIPFPIRQAVIRRVQSGESVSEIAEAVSLSGRTIRSLVAQFQQSGEAGLKPDYSRCGRRRSDQNDQLCEATIQLREQHPKWGAGRIRVELTQQFPEAPLPSKRTLERWLRDNELVPAPAGRPSQVDYVRASSPHEVWQVDAGEQKKLASGKMVSWLRFVDECSGAVLKTFVFSPRALQLRPRSRRSEPFSPCFSGVGLARWRAGGQRKPVGFAGRFADGFEFVAVRIADHIDLESAAPAAVQWGRGAVQPLGERLGRAWAMPKRPRVATAYRSRRPSAAGDVSRLRRPIADRSLSRAQNPPSPLHARRGETRLGSRVGQGVVVALCSSTTRGWLRKNWSLRRQVVRGHKTQANECATSVRSDAMRVGDQQSPKSTTGPRACRDDQQTLHLEFKHQAVNPSAKNGRTLCRYFAAELYVA
jgi:transposase